MTEFSPIRASVDAWRFIFRHAGPFLLLVLAWTALAAILKVGLCALIQPAGPKMPLTVQLAALEGTSSERLVDLIPNLLGTMAISVIWTQFILLDRTIGNPLRLSAEMFGYFVQSLKCGFLAIFAAMPGAALAVLLGGAMPSNKIAAIGIVLIGGLIAIAGMIAVYGRLCISLAAVAVDRAVAIDEAFRLTTGFTVGLALGLLLAYSVPFLLSFLAGVVFGIVLRAFPGDIVSIGYVFVVFGMGFVLAGTVAGYSANVLRGLMPGDVTGSIARQFE